MNFPKLKHARLCRILTYAVVIGAFIIPIIIIANISIIPIKIKFITGMLLIVGLIIYMLKNFMVLMCMDLMLAILHCYNTARKEFTLPDLFSVEKTEKRISRFGKSYPPTALYPQPKTLRYKLNTPITVYSSGIEKVIAIYHTDFLDKDGYKAIFSSAKVNSKALTGMKKPIFLDKEQKKSPLNRVTIAFIFANKVDESLRSDLFDLVCKEKGDEEEISFLPCVIDLERRVCIFDSLRIPYVGYSYAVKNRGIRIIRKYIFGGKLPLKHNQNMLYMPNDDINPEESLWSFWHKLNKEFVLDEKNDKRRFNSMSHREIILEDDCLYIKWEERGISAGVEFIEDSRTAEVALIDLWNYPKSNKVSKKALEEIKKTISIYIAGLGYTTKFVEFDD